MGTEFLKIKEFEEALEIIKNLFNENYTCKSENISINNCYNRVLFNDINSEIALPPFNKSLMDGFAIKAEDSFGASEESPKILKCIDQIEAGSSSKKIIKNGECIEIATGAPIPNGANAVAMIEFCEKIGENINVFKSLRPNENIAQKGSDIKSGEIVLNAKDVLNPGKIGFLSAQGMKNVEVYKKPVIGIISTGNELLKEGEVMEIGRIYDVNSHTIKNAIISCGCEAKTIGIIRDNYKELRNTIESALESCDIIICSGGTSAGVGDVLRHVIDDIGETIIHGISIKPGKPTIVGKINLNKEKVGKPKEGEEENYSEISTKLIIGLPGNPVSALVVFYAFISKELKKLSGNYNKYPNHKTISKGKIVKRYISSLGRVEYLLVKLKNTKNRIEIYPIVKDSGAITSINEADAYIKIAKNTEIIEENSEVELYYLN